MSKSNNLFLRIIGNENLIAAFDIDPTKYQSIEDGRNSSNLHVRAIAETLIQMEKVINDAQADMRIRNKVGPVVLTDEDYQPVYKKIVSLLSK
jgi:ribonuclease D